MEQLKDMLREVLKEELAPIIIRIDGLEDRFDGLENRFDGLENRFDGLETRFDGLETRFDGLETRFDGLENQMTEIKTQLHRMEIAQKDDIVAMLRVIDKKITTGIDSAGTKSIC